ncbi:conserved hypothetical protein [Ricinus communis]|uniref:RNase H type-1 domain-containing protein n=1 Tax=Ricinus communis TaxID=3988 RepID=B9S509_RICCO|nr:conserved hypothetical protein [Ricinus communis]
MLQKIHSSVDYSGGSQLLPMDTIAPLWAAPQRQCQSDFHTAFVKNRQGYTVPFSFGEAVQYIASAIQAEAYGLSPAVKWARRSGLPSVIFEGDCKCVIDTVNAVRDLSSKGQGNVYF